MCCSNSSCPCFASVSNLFTRIAGKYFVSTLAELDDVSAAIQDEIQMTQHPECLAFLDRLAAVRLQRLQNIPAPRLVGIELNPGPRGRTKLQSNPLIASLVRDAVASLVPTGKVLPSAGKRTKRRRRKATNLGMSSSTSSTSAPVSRGLVTRTNPSSSMIVPFSLTGCEIHQGVTPNSYLEWRNLATIQTYGLTAFEGVKPLPLFIDSVVGGGTGIFTGIHNTVLSKLFGVFSKYRFRSLRVSFVPILPTSAPGNYIMAVIKDPAVSSAVAGTYSNVSSTNNAISAPIWQTTSIDVGPSDWLKCDNEVTAPSNPEIDALMRQTTCGAMQFATLGVEANTSAVSNRILGAFKFDGVLELRDLTDNSGL